MACSPDVLSVQFTVIQGAQIAIYTITFAGVTYVNGTSTWCYNVEVEGNPGLSHWVLGLCPEPAPEIISATRADEPVIFEGPGTFDGVFGIKFDEGVESTEGVIKYCVTLNGEFEATAVDVAVKGGQPPAQNKRNALCGPGCQIRTTIRRGFKF